MVDQASSHRRREHEISTARSRPARERALPGTLPTSKPLRVQVGCAPHVAHLQFARLRMPQPGALRRAAAARNLWIDSAVFPSWLPQW